MYVYIYIYIYMYVYTSICIHTSTSSSLSWSPVWHLPPNLNVFVLLPGPPGPFHPGPFADLLPLSSCFLLYPNRCNQIKIMPFIQTSLAKAQGKAKAQVYRAACVQYDAVSCCLSAKQMTTSKQCKVPINEDAKLDHATKFGTTLPRQRRCNCLGD
jgi:hypothetical protein